MFQLVHVPDGTVPNLSGTDRPTPKERLLAAVLAHLGEHGLKDTSMRGLAAAVGTSHRMLSYHFGSRQALLVEVSRTVERQQREAFAAMLTDRGASPVDVMWSMFRRLVDPALESHERLFFELYGRALQSEPRSGGFIPEVVEAWIAPLSELFVRLGFEQPHATDEARLALAVARGLILDLLATDDRAAVEAAMARYVSRYDRRAASERSSGAYAT